MRFDCPERPRRTCSRSSIGEFRSVSWPTMARHREMIAILRANRLDGQHRNFLLRRAHDRWQNDPHSRRSSGERCASWFSAPIWVRAPCSRYRCCGKKRVSVAITICARCCRTVYGTADRAARNFCRPGRDRHRERAAVPRTQGIIGAADCDE